MQNPGKFVQNAIKENSIIVAITALKGSTSIVKPYNTTVVTIIKGQLNENISIENSLYLFKFIQYLVHNHNIYIVVIATYISLWLLQYN